MLCLQYRRKMFFAIFLLVIIARNSLAFVSTTGRSLTTSNGIASSTVPKKESLQFPILFSSTLEAVEIEEGTSTTTNSTFSGSGTATTKKRLEDCKPGMDENSKFVCDDESVFMWRDFQANEFASLEENVNEISRVASRFAAMGPASAAYFAKHVGRSAYFLTNALLGSTAFELNQRFSQGRNVDASSLSRSSGGSLLPFGISGAAASRILLEAMLTYEQDYKWIHMGVYREPWDMKFGNRQSSPINLMTQTGRFVREAMGTLGRRAISSQEGKKVKFFGQSEKSVKVDLYPDYYQNAFHYQTDGWMSSDSANVYETSTETLFVGRQDAMQRTTLPPIMQLSKKFEQGMPMASRRPMRVLEIACGTGRFMTFVRDNLPLDAGYTAIDLSPFYLEKARDNDNYWRRIRTAEERRKNGLNSGTIPAISPANLIQAKAEDLPFEDESFDAVICLYLFHELPRDVRARAVSEMARVVAPGGTVVLTDSIQRGDRPALDVNLGDFERMNEPYYNDYLSDDLSVHFEKGGLKPMTKIVRSSTKSLSFEKPGTLDLNKI